MRNRIIVKVFLAFTAALFCFSLLVGSAFNYMFRAHVIYVKKQDMTVRAIKIAQTLGESRDQWLAWLEKRKEERASTGENTAALERAEHLPLGPRSISFNSVLRFLGTAAAEDVWIVDNEHHLEVTPNGNRPKPKLFYKDLPPNAEQVVKKVMEGATTDSTGFSDMLEVPTMTVGTPIKDKDGNVLGAVLIHAPLAGMDTAAREGTRILIMCGGFALLVAFLLAMYLSWRLTKPLKIMRSTAEKMKAGDYTARCAIKQTDEVGDLATTLDSLGERLLVASKESAQLDQMRKDFIANISHELRTPVTVIRGSLEALNDKVVTKQEKVEEYYREMLSETIFLQRLINDLLDLSRLQNTNFKIEMTELNFCSVLQDVAHSGQKLSRDKAIKVELNMDRNIYKLKGDYGRLRQMLMVFVDNAIKFSPRQAVIEIQLAGRQLQIRDHGQGVDAKLLPHVFDRFSKTRNETNKSGTGLGLAIAKEIAERHNMQVSMTSEPGQGTTVHLELEGALNDTQSSSSR